MFSPIFGRRAYGTQYNSFLAYFTQKNTYFAFNQQSLYARHNSSPFIHQQNTQPFIDLPFHSFLIDLFAIFANQYNIYSVMILEKQEQGLVEHTYRVTKDQLLKLCRFICNISSPLIDRVQPIVQPILITITPYYQKTREFYNKHQLIILVVSAVTVTYLIVRPKKEDQSKQKKKKTSSVRRQIGNKTFISDNSEADNHDEPSTGTRREVESSGREALQRKKVESKYLERIESSSEEEESGDKIFFQVYKTYQVSSNNNS